VFEYVSGPTGIAQASLPFSGWGTRLVDLDNDGFKDVLVAQGHVLDTVELTSAQFTYREPALVLKGDGRRFAPFRGANALRRPWAGRGAAFGDLDNDGDLDVVIGTSGERGLVFRNDSAGGHRSLTLRLEGRRSNRDGLGALVRTRTPAGLVQTHLVTTSGSYQSASDRRVIVGLGSSDRVEALDVRWPSGAQQRLTGIVAGREVVLREPER
jgi:hypothetical protein